MSFTVGTSFRFTVVVPTHERRELAVSVVQSLARQREAPSFEVVVVVDGSTDGSAHALRRLEPAFPLTVVEQPNRGAAAARNAGASRARGELLLFLDDDMEADRDLIAEHEREHRRGADVVLGHLPLHPGSPRSVLAEGVDCWTQGRVRRLSEPGAKLTLHDLLTGQVSLSRDTFQAIGGFDTSFTRGGSFGGEDIDFGYRLQKAGYRIVFNPAAISWQRYIVGPKQYFRQWRQAGRSDAELSRKHPERAAEIAELAQVTDAWSRLILTRLTATPVLARTATATLSTLVTWLVGSRHRGACTRRLCGLAKKLEYLRGAHQGGGLRGPGLVVVLAYHSVTHLRSDGLLAPYSVTPKELASHLDFLAHEGYRFIDLGELCEALGGAMPLPERGVLLSFDDCYENLRSEALPVLAQRAMVCGARTRTSP